MRFAFVILGTVVASLMALGTVYFWGLSQVYPRFDHPFLEAPLPWIAVPYQWAQDTEVNGPKDVTKPETLQWWVDIYRSSGGALVVNSQAGALSLHDLLAEAPPHQKWILNFKQNTEDLDRQAADILRPLASRQDFLVQSDFDIVLRATKAEFAPVPYGSSQSDRMRFRTFGGMAPWPGGLLPATPFRGDVFVTPLKWHAVSLIDDAIRTELKRRQKPLLLGPLSSRQELEQAQQLRPEGVYLTEKSLLPEWRRLAH